MNGVSIVDILYILVISAAPIVELRGAIPVGIITLDIDPLVTLLVAILGNMIPVVVILALLGVCVDYCRKYNKRLDTFFAWWFQRVISNHEEKFKRWGALALILLVAIPLPMTGAWTGSVGAYLFKIEPRKAFFYILVGVIIAGGIVTGLTLTGASLF